MFCVHNFWLLSKVNLEWNFNALLKAPWEECFQLYAILQSILSHKGSIDLFSLLNFINAFEDALLGLSRTAVSYFPVLSADAENNVSITHNALLDKFQ